MQARPSYSDMAALIELGDKPFYFNVLILILECLFLRKLLSRRLSSTTLFLDLPSAGRLRCLCCDGRSGLGCCLRFVFHFYFI